MHGAIRSNRSMQYSLQQRFWSSLPLSHLSDIIDLCNTLSAVSSYLYNISVQWNNIQSVYIYTHTHTQIYRHIIYIHIYIVHIHIYSSYAYIVQGLLKPCKAKSVNSKEKNPPYLQADFEDSSDGNLCTERPPPQKKIRTIIRTIIHVLLYICA